MKQFNNSQDFNNYVLEKAKIRETLILDERGILSTCEWCGKTDHKICCDCNRAREWDRIRKVIDSQRARYPTFCILTPNKLISTRKQQ